MLIKTRIYSTQKYVKINEPSLEEFLNSAFLKFSVPPVTEGARVFYETGTEVDAEVFEEIAQQPNVGILTIKFDNEFRETSSTNSQETRSQESSSSPLPAGSADNTVILEILSCHLDDMIILEESDSPTRKHGRAYEEAKHVVELALTKRPEGDRVIKEYNRTKTLSDSSRRQMVNILVADMTEKHG